MTSGTIFHKLKFELRKAIGMLYDISTSKKGANSIWLAERYGVNQKTAWLFRQKVQLSMESSKLYPLEKEVHVDEFEIGTPPSPGSRAVARVIKKSVWWLLSKTGTARPAGVTPG